MDIDISDWPEKMRTIYRQSASELGNDEMPLLYGPAHIVWADQNWGHAQWCLDHFMDFRGDLSARELAVVRRSLEQVVVAGVEQTMKLHIGGTEPREGWEILNIQPPADYVGNCTDLSRFADGSFETVYASHVLEHLGAAEIVPTLSEVRRILVPGGQLLVSVPDLDSLARLFLSPNLTPEHRWYVQRVIYGGQTDQFDFHKIGFTAEFLASMAQEAGFSRFARVVSHGIFEDTSEIVVFGAKISLNAVMS